MKPSFLTYVSAAFNARPLGMPIPPNWIGIAGAGILGFLNPGIWLIAAGIELSYLLVLASNKRFRATVDGAHLSESNDNWEARRNELFKKLSATNRKRQEALEDRCRTILLNNNEQALGQQQAENLAQLTWVHLRLLLSHHRVEQVVAEADQPADIARRIRELEHQLGNSSNEQLNNSLRSQLDILLARQSSQSKAREQLALIDAELERLRQQVELVREQTALSSDAEAASRTIDALGTTLNETTHWLSDQRDIMGEVDDLSTTPPPSAIFATRTQNKTAQ
jgi:hypothetical protein